MTSWKIQNDITDCVAGFIRKTIKENILKYYVIIAGKVTDQFPNKEIFLLCLRYVTYQNVLPIKYELLFDSLYIECHPTEQTIAKTFYPVRKK